MDSIIHFPADDLVLEGLLSRQPDGKGVVIAHPHPLYGGDMHNPVVQMIAEAYLSFGFTTLCFNFRGVGGSAGSYDDGRGESSDVVAAAKFLLGAGVSTLHFAGYSFGAWVMAGIEALPEQVVAQIYVAPPVGLLDFDHIAHIPHLHGAITGQYDDIAPSRVLKNLMGVWNHHAVLDIIPGGDHFFGGAEQGLTTSLKRMIGSAESLHFPG